MGERQKGKGPSQRQLRMGELLRHALSEVFLRSEITDRDLEGVTITVVEVQVSPDGRNATCFVTPLGGGDKERVVQALMRHTRFIRGELGRRVELKFIPALKFEADSAFDRSQQIDRLLRSPQVARDLK